MGPGWALRAGTAYRALGPGCPARALGARGAAITAIVVIAVVIVVMAMIVVVSITAFVAVALAVTCNRGLGGLAGGTCGKLDAS